VSDQPGGGGVVERFDQLLAAEAAHDLRASIAEASWQSYRANLADYDQWRTAQHDDLDPLSVDAVVGYLHALAESGTKPNTLTRRRTAIAKLVELETVAGTAPAEDPTRHHLVVNLLRTLRQQSAGPRRAEPLTGARLVRILDTIDPATLAGIRDRALFLIGFYGALRAGELVDLAPRALTFTTTGVEITVNGDTIAVGRRPGDQHDPVAVLEHWLTALDDLDGPLDPDLGIWRRITRADRLFQPSTAITFQSINTLVTRRADAAGLADPDTYTLHSLRTGFITEAQTQGIDPLDLLRHTRQRSLPPHSPRSTRPADPDNDPTTRLDLPRPRR
jgi:integrase